jgi:hypothetical protein
MVAQRVRKLSVNVGFAGVLLFAWWQGHRSEAAGAADESGGRGFALREVARASGIDFVHRAPVLDPRLAHVAPLVGGVGAAVSIVDADDDGWADVYAVSSAEGSANALYRNQGDGTFRDVARAAGVADDERDGGSSAMGSIWADVTGDGLSDGFVYKWGWPRLFVNRGELRFEDVTADAGLRRRANSNAAVFLDYDRDGWLDLYVAGYFRDDVDLADLRDTRIMQESFEFARNGGHNRLMRNRGGLRFQDVTREVGGDSTRWTFAVASADFDEDGWPDLYLANDYGPEELFLNREGKILELLAGVGLDEKSKSGMCVALGDIWNQDRLAVYVTNISKRGFLFQGNNLRVDYLREEGRFFQMAEGPELECGWAWGAQFGDLDDDGFQDLVVVNGFVSASPERDYWYDMSKIAGALGDVFEDARNWPAIGDRSLSGYERTRLLWNRGGRGFFDVAEQVGLDDRLDGRSVALADLFHDGTLDLVIANQAGPLLVYRNERRSENHWIGIELEGAGANRDAIGARVRAEFGGHRQVQFVTAGTGFSSQNERCLHFGLGSAEAVERVVVRWPSGAEQVLEGLAADRRHQIVEAP